MLTQCGGSSIQVKESGGCFKLRNEKESIFHTMKLKNLLLQIVAGPQIISGFRKK